jgi:hypothetical protein
VTHDIKPFELKERSHAQTAVDTLDLLQAATCLLGYVARDLGNLPGHQKQQARAVQLSEAVTLLRFEINAPATTSDDSPSRCLQAKEH